MVSNPVRVLLVDDAEEMRVLLRAVLERDGRFVIAAESPDGLAAIEVTESVMVDAIVLDEMMPIMSGSEALPYLRAAAPDATIVMFSAAPRHVVTGRLCDEPDAFVAKGADMTELLAALLSARQTT